MRKRYGFTLVELTVAMGIAGVLALVDAQSSQLERSQSLAKTLGNEVYQYNAAVSRYLAANAGDTTVAGTHTGSGWLKDTSCSGGSASDGYLACSMIPNDRTTTFHTQPRTEISAEPDGSLIARTVWDTIVGDNNRPDTMVMGMAALVASGNYVSQIDDAASGYQTPTVFCPNIIGESASIKDICDSNKDVIVSMVNINGSLDTWLRTDHQNTMRHVLEFDPNGVPTSDSVLKLIEDRAGDSWLRQIANVSKIYNGRGVGSQSLTLGASSGNSLYGDAFLINNSLLNDAVIVDANLAAMGDVYLKSNLYVNQNVEVLKKVVIGEDLEVGGDIHADTGDVHAIKFISSNDSSYFIEPDGTSTIQALEVIGDVSADRLVITGSRTKGGACSPTGAVARDSAGVILSCQSGTWKEAATGTPKGMYGFFKSTTCPSGWVAATGSNGTVNLRDRFIRGWSSTSGRSVESFQNDAMQRMTGKVYSDATDSAGQYKAATGVFYNSSYDSEVIEGDSGYKKQGPYARQFNFDSARQVRTANETRPDNIALLACMKQ